VSGPYEGLGTDTRNAIETYLREINHTVLGRPVEVVLEDTEGKPDVALRKVEKLVTKDGCKFLTGPISSAESMAIADKLPGLGALYMCTISKTAKLTGPACNKYIFRSVMNDSQDANVARFYLDANPDLKAAKWGIVGADYEWGRDVASNFKAKSGTQIMFEEFAPLGNKDFSTLINKLREAKPDAVYVANAGQDQINFIKQAAGFGLTKTIKFLWATSIPEKALQALGDLALGLMCVSAYTWTIDTPGNKTFVADYKKVASGEPPSMYAGDTYIGMKLLFAAIEKAGSTDVDKVIPVLEATSIDSPTKATIRKGDHQAIRDDNVAIVEKNADSPAGVALKVIYAAPGDKVIPPVEETGCKMSA
jgi:branched-chain amino acid transport system substrate-binding protein